MKKSDRKPVTEDEISDLIYELTRVNYDNKVVHTKYDDILERYCLYPDITLAPLMEQLICEAREVAEFWYA